MLDIEETVWKLLAHDAGGVLVAKVPAQDERVGFDDLNRGLGYVDGRLPVQIDRSPVLDVAILCMNIDLDPVFIVGQAEVFVIGVGEVGKVLGMDAHDRNGRFSVGVFG